MAKNITLVFLLLGLAIFGGLLAREHRQAQAESVQIARLEKQAAVLQKEIQTNRDTTTEREEKQRQAATVVQAEKQARREAREAAAAAQAAVTPDPAGDISAPAVAKKKDRGANFLNGSLAKMMKDPAMKNMMRSVQGTALKQGYADFVKQQRLSPEQADAFYEAILDKQSAMMDKGMKLLDKGDDGAAAVDTGDPDAKVKAVLGDDAYAQYTAYEKTLAGRFTVGQFQQQLAASNTPALTPDQSNALLEAVNSEKINFSGNDLKSAMGTGDKSFMTDPAKLDQFVKAQEELNGRIDARVEYMLTPDQLKVLKSQQQQTIAMQRMGMEMAAKMMAPSPTP